MMYIKNGSAKTNIDHVITASLRDSLDGEVSLTLTLDASYREYITDGTVIECGDYYFDVALYEYKTLGDTYTVYVAADHVSCRLNTSFGEGGFAMQGTPAQILAAILGGSDFSVGTVENSTVYTVAIHGNTYRKSAVMQLAELCGCEIVYSGFEIGLVKRRGSDVPYELTEKNILIGIDYSRDVVNDTERYILDIGQLGELEVGQTVNVVYLPYGLNGKTARVLSVEYNPYDKFEAVVEVGEYTPDITGEMIGQADDFNKAKWEFEANDNRLMSRITDAEGSITTLEQTSSSITARIENAEGNISVLEQTVNGFEMRITNAEGDASDALATAETLEFRVTNAEGNISTISQTADKINWLVKSGTSASDFTLTDRAISLVAQNIDLTGFVTFNALSTAGQTTINGSNITTGTISASRIGANNGSYITFGSPVYMNASYADIYNLNSLQFGGDNCWVRGNDDIAGSNAVQIRATGGFYYHNGTYNYPVIHSGNIASYVVFQ